MIAAILHVANVALVTLFLALQPLDVISTILALRQPNVIEVGDTALGLGNLSGWAQKNLGIFWPVIKLPALVTAVIYWSPVGPVPLEVLLFLALALFNTYFAKIVWQNFKNAKVIK